MKKLIAVLAMLAIVTMSIPAFAATKTQYNWVKNPIGTESEVSWRWPTCSVPGNGSNLADVDWDKLPETQAKGRVYKDLANKSHWNIYLTGVGFQHNVGVKSDDENSFTDFIPEAFAIVNEEALKNLGFTTDDILALALNLGGRDGVLRINNMLTGVAFFSVEDETNLEGILLFVFQWKDGSIGGIVITPDNKVALVRRLLRAYKVDTPHVGPSITTEEVVEDKPDNKPVVPPTITTDPVQPDGQNGNTPKVNPSINTEQAQQDGQASSTGGNGDAALGNIADRYKSNH